MKQNMIQRDLIRNTFHNEIKNHGFIFFITGSIIYFEETKKLICTNYAKKTGEEYNDFNFSVQGLFYDFEKHTLHVNFILGSMGVSTEMRMA